MPISRRPRRSAVRMIRAIRFVAAAAQDDSDGAGARVNAARRGPMHRAACPSTKR